MILFDDAIKGDDVRAAGRFRRVAGIPVKYVAWWIIRIRAARSIWDCAGLLPGYKPSGCRDDLTRCSRADLDVLWVVGANPLRSAAVQRKAGFLVVQDMFLTETAQHGRRRAARGHAYEKNGTVTNVTGEVQRLKRAIQTMGAKPDLEIMGFIAREMGVAAALGPWPPLTGFRRDSQERARLRRSVPVIATGGAAQTMPVNGRIPVEDRARSGALRPQWPVYVGHAGALL